MNLSNISQRFFQFPGDESLRLEQRQTPGALYAWVNPEAFEHPQLVLFNHKLSQKIGLGAYQETDLPFLVGNNLPQNIRPYSTAYAGHQFGNWAGQLGDGRAIFAGENHHEGKYYEIQWKGAGATPYSRHADGRAVFRSSLREYLMSEAMHHLGIPTTRALSLSFTGEKVQRDLLYNGNPQMENGAVVMRVSESFLRFGHFEFAHLQRDKSLLKHLADFTIENYFSEIDGSKNEKYALWFEKVTERTLQLIIEWMRVGFVHGVMNTDNMSIMGETIDYGPFSMLDEYDLNFTPNTTDLPARRYAFGRQGQIAQWNLWQLANALFPLIKDADFLQSTLEKFGENFVKKHDQMLASKFGLDTMLSTDEALFIHWQKLMTAQKLDHTLFFTTLESVISSDTPALLAHTSYLPDDQVDLGAILDFYNRYSNRLNKNTITKAMSIKMMKSHNPRFILRNYLLYDCIQKVETGDTQMLHQLIESLENPYESIHPKFEQKRPPHYDQVSGCSMLSCSS